MCCAEFLKAVHAKCALCFAVCNLIHSLLVKEEDAVVGAASAKCIMGTACLPITWPSGRENDYFTWDAGCSMEVPLASLNPTSGEVNDLWLTVEPPQPAQHRWNWLLSWCRPRRPSKDWSSHVAQVRFGVHQFSPGVTET